MKLMKGRIISGDRHSGLQLDPVMLTLLNYKIIFKNKINNDVN